MSGLGFNPRAVETQRGSIPPQWRHPSRRVEIAFAHAGNRTQGTSMGGLYVATTLHARTQPERLGGHAFSRDCGRQRNVTLTHTTHPDDTLAEWLRRRPAKPNGSPCVGSNPTCVAHHHIYNSGNYLMHFNHNSYHYSEGSFTGGNREARFEAGVPELGLPRGFLHSFLS